MLALLLSHAMELKSCDILINLSSTLCMPAGIVSLKCDNSMILACSLVLPAPSSSQRRGRAKKAQAAVKSEEEDMQAGQSTSQPDSASQQEAELGPSQQEAEMEVAAVLTAGVDLTEDADEAALPLVDRLAGMVMHADSAESRRRDTELQHHLYTSPQVYDSTQVHASNHALS